MINLAFDIKPAILKQPLHLKLKSLKALESINIFSMPSRVSDKDITAMFNGLLCLLREKIQQEQSEKYLRLKLKYNKLKSLYNLTKNQLQKRLL